MLTTFSVTGYLARVLCMILSRYFTLYIPMLLPVSCVLPRSSPLPLSVLPLADVDDDSSVSYCPEPPPLWAYYNQRTVKVHTTAPTSLMSSPHPFPLSFSVFSPPAETGNPRIRPHYALITACMRVGRGLRYVLLIPLHISV